MMHVSPRRFLSRGPGVPVPDDQALLSLVPVGELVPFDQVLMQLTDIRLGELSPWVWVAPGDCSWPPLWEYRVAADIEIRRSIGRRVLELTISEVEAPKSPSFLALLSGSIGAVLMSLCHLAPGRLAAPSRVQREADSIVQALRF
jgi:hypothetical protein